MFKKQIRILKMNTLTRLDNGHLSQFNKKKKNSVVWLDYYFGQTSKVLVSHKNNSIKRRKNNDSEQAQLIKYLISLQNKILNISQSFFKMLP